MQSAAAGSPEELAAVRHLVELGYEDPLEAAERRRAAESAQEQEIQQADQLLREGQTAAAIAMLESAAREAPEWTAVRHWLARARYRAGQWDETRELLNWLELHGVEHPELALMRAALALRQRRLDEAADQAAYAKCLLSPLPKADMILGEVALRRGAADAAAEAFQNALGHAASRADAMIGLSAAALRGGSSEEAADWALQAIESGTTRWEAHCHLGRALLRLGRPAEARVALEHSAQMASGRAAPYRWLIDACEQAGDQAAAGHARQRARQVIASRRK